VLVGGRHHAHVHLHGFGRAHRLEALLFQHAQHLGLGAQAHVAHFVQEERAAVAFWNFPILVSWALVKLPLMWPNSSLSISSSGKRSPWKALRQQLALMAGT